jgi:3-oxoacyl-[acyl-carrier-protein] synthase-1/3-oxoacyl-[acyl-carrier-protein] synthase II
VVASSALSALGLGADATPAGRAGEPAPSGLRALETTRETSGRLVGRVDFEANTTERATALLVAAALDLALRLDARLPGWRRTRLRVLVGTSAGPMNAALAAFAERASGGRLSSTLAAQTPYFAPLAALASALGVELLPEQVLGACASSTLASGLGCRALDAERVELVIAGGYDALSPFVAAGFEALGAVSRGVPAPFRTARDGMALGEGAGLVALVRAAPGGACEGHVLGFGASSDAVHTTAPDRDGNGVFEAARAALADAGLGADEIDLLSAHATSTPYNDAAEARALRRLFGARPLPVSAFKAQIGHTLGAAGVLETLCALDALRRGIVPAVAGSGEIEPDFTGELASRARSQKLGAALKLSSAFGGLNAALVLAHQGGLTSGAERPRSTVRLTLEGYVVREGNPSRVELAAPGKGQLVERADGVSELALAAVAELVLRLGRPLHERAAIVVGSAAATLEQNERFEARRRDGRPVEPRRFPLTSPSACAGFCSIVFGLKGPSFAAGSGPGAGRDALVLGHDLVAAGDASEVVVVAVEDVGPVVTDVFLAAGLGVPRRGAGALLLGTGAAGPVIDRDRPEATLTQAGWVEQGWA